MGLSSFCKSLNIPFNAKPLRDYDSLILIGTQVLRDEPQLKSLLDAKEFFLLSSIEDTLSDSAKQFVKYEAGTEEAILALFFDTFTQTKDENLKQFLATLDIGYLSAESNFGEEEAQELYNALHVKNLAFVIGYDLELHPNAKNIAKFLGLIAYYCNIDIFLLGQESSKTATCKPVFPDEIDKLVSFDGTIVYRCPTLKDEDKGLLYGSKQFALSAKVKDKDAILIKTAQNEYKREFRLDESLKGTIALLPTNKSEQMYRFEVSKITQVRTANE